MNMQPLQKTFRFEILVRLWRGRRDCVSPHRATLWDDLGRSLLASLAQANGSYLRNLSWAPAFRCLDREKARRLLLCRRRRARRFWWRSEHPRRSQGPWSLFRFPGANGGTAEAGGASSSPPSSSGQPEREAMQPSDKNRRTVSPVTLPIRPCFSDVLPNACSSQSGRHKARISVVSRSSCLLCHQLSSQESLREHLVSLLLEKDHISHLG